MDDPAKEYAYTTAAALPTTPQKEDIYTYDSIWKDKLVDINGKALTYDAIGNLTSYDGTTYSWSMGRQLAGVENGKSIQYAYNHTGMRVKKVVDGVTTEYHLAGVLITGESTNGSNIWYNYDSQSNLIFMVYNHVDYFYVRNAQGDIIALIDKAGNKVVEYTYDSWGAPVSVTGSMAATLGKKNPFRYRGYYYDEETGLYYVSSRYYDPEISRFISADDTDVLEVKNDLYNNNLYIYCDNNPVIRVDEEGTIWKLALVGGGFISSGIEISFGGGILTVLGAITPVGWGVIGLSAITRGIGIMYSKNKAPKGRAESKKQGRENIEKKKGSKNWEKRSGKKPRTQVLSEFWVN